MGTNCIPLVADLVFIATKEISLIYKANTTNTGAPDLDLHISIANRFVSSKSFDNCMMTDFDIVFFTFLVGDVRRRPSYGVYILQLNKFAGVFDHVIDMFTARLLQQDYQYHKLRKLRKTFSIADTMNSFANLNDGLKTHLREDLSESEFYCNLVYKFNQKIILRCPCFSFKLFFKNEQNRLCEIFSISFFTEWT